MDFCFKTHTLDISYVRWARTRGEGTQQSFIRRGSPPPRKFNPFTLLCTIFDREGSPFVCLRLTNDTPFLPLASLYRWIPFNCCKCTVFKIWIDHNTRKFSRPFHSHKKISSISPFRFFYSGKGRFPYPFNKIKQVKSLPFNCPWINIPKA